MLICWPTQQTPAMPLEITAFQDLDSKKWKTKLQNQKFYGIHTSSLHWFNHGQKGLLTLQTGMDTL